MHVDTHMDIPPYISIKINSTLHGHGEVQNKNQCLFS